MTTDKDAAYRRAVKILAASDNTPAALLKKLCAKGFSEEDAESAVKRLSAEGFLDEKKLLEKTVRALYEKKYGPLYIAAALVKKDFSKKAIRAAEKIMSELDFDASARAYAKELSGAGADGAKITAALIRRGFETDTEI